MEIIKIILKNWENSLISKKTVIFDNLNQKSINVFLMPNSAWKSLIFNSLEHLFSYNKKPFIKKTNQDLEIEILFNINWKLYTFISNYYCKYKVLKNWEEVKNFDSILEEYMWIRWEKLEYSGNSRNSLYSLNRFNFLDFSTIFDKENTNEIPFIDSRYDRISRRFILAYVLWAKIEWWFFKLITDYEDKKDFIKKHKTKFEKYLNNLEQMKLIDNNIKTLFVELEDNRIIFWDISIAIKELSLLREEYVKVFWYNYNDEDYIFLSKELENLEKEKLEIENNILKIKESIRWNKLIEWNDLIDDKVFKSKELLEFYKYNQCKVDIKKFDELKIDNYLTNNIDPFISQFKFFLVDLYKIFIDKAILSNLIKKDDILKDWNIIFKEDTLTIEAFFKTSEWIRKTLRILTFIWLHIFSNKNKTKCLDYSFYDSFIENIDYQFREVLFDTIFEFITKNNITVPSMYLFITKVEEKLNDSSIYKLWDKFSKHINIIDSIWLK